MATSSDHRSEEHLVARRVRDVAAVTLAITSGATDAIAFLALGGAFTSVMTGNMVLLGISLGQADTALGRQIAVAVIGYIAGCYIGARITGPVVPGDRIWPPAVTRGLLVEVSLFALYAVGWWAVGGHPTGWATGGLLGVSALALGIQSATVRRFGVPGLSTTYLTGTLTTLVTSLATGGRFRDVARHLALLVALVSGAATAGLLLALHAADFLPLVQLAPLGVVVSMAGAASSSAMRKWARLATRRSPGRLRFKR
jgi:uncharacterized membrane protein YoaK (UPF0700 family)